MIAEKRYRVELETVEPLRIGGVEDPRSGIHNPVTRLGNRVVIPGPSLKGALRAQMEQFLIETYYNNSSQSWPEDKLAFQPCIPAPRPSTDEVNLINARKYRSEACHYPCEFEKESGREVFRGKCTKNGRPNPHSICPVCYLFGAQGLPGFLRIPWSVFPAPARSGGAVACSVFPGPAQVKADNHRPAGRIRDPALPGATFPPHPGPTSP